MQHITVATRAVVVEQTLTMHVTIKEVESELLFGFRCEYNIWAFPQDPRGPGRPRLGFLSAHAHFVLQSTRWNQTGTLFSPEKHLRFIITQLETKQRLRFKHTLYVVNDRLKAGTTHFPQNSRNYSDEKCTKQNCFERLIRRYDLGSRVDNRLINTCSF